MNRDHLIELDRALLRLVEERARLTMGATPEHSAPALEDLLRRSTGTVPADAVRGLFQALQRCRADVVAPREVPT